MAFEKIKVDTSAFEEKLKVAHKHIGAMLEEIQSICNECGSTNTEIQSVSGDQQVVYKVKICIDCDSSEIIETEFIP